MTNSITERILDLFNWINQIPRCSKNEAEISRRLRSWAAENGFEARNDQADNVVITVPPTEGFENAPTVVLQGHMDMVCEKTKNSDHDFANDPIKVSREDQWLKADGTTLGADNGIGVAMALAAATEKDLGRPRLELLFTADEETGLNGANDLSGDFITGKILINLDSEDEGVFTIGCAGGRGVQITLPVEKEPLPEGPVLICVSVSGARGGHSGVDIHRNRVNAVKMLSALLKSIHGNCPFGLVSLSGGSADNVIPRDALAEIAVHGADASRFKQALTAESEALLETYRQTEPALSIEGTNAPTENRPMVSMKHTERLLRLLEETPHGVLAVSEDYDDLVETSINLAAVSLSAESLLIRTKMRSSSMEGMDRFSSRIKKTAGTFGAEFKESGHYASWEPNKESRLLHRSIRCYSSLYGKEPRVEIIHAGLECGVIGSKYPNMDMISMGPNIRNAHSPEEKLNIPSVGKVYDFLCALLSSFG